MEFSDKQKLVLNKFLAEDRFFYLLSGSIRSGKSYVAVLAFFLYTQSIGPSRVNIISGRNLRIMEVELLSTLEEVAHTYGSSYKYSRTTGVIDINGVRYIVVAAHDENSYKRIQSLTAGGALVDEVQLMPESFLNQLIARVSFADSKILATCNPEGKRHWLKTKFIDENKVDYLENFTLEDNPVLPEEVKARYRGLFSGVFYERNILGKWVQAEGVIYKDYSFVDNINPKDILYSDIGIDYGIKSITAFEKLTYLRNGTCVITKTYRYNGNDGIKTDSDLADDLIGFVGKDKIQKVFIDPSASSFIAELRRRRTSFTILEADNKVLPGIKTVLNGFGSKKLLILKTKNNEPLTDELTTYAWDDKKDDTVIKSDDHHCDALRYGYYSRNKTVFNRVVKIPRGLGL